MFERYTERARRVVFFARYEASQYGSHVIETEHLLLGLLRVSAEVVEQLTAEPAIGAEIREEIERRWMHQMSTVLVANGAEWEIAVLHVTVVRPS
jgi:ATP-dependent Clp protease ATP-binding subunit ClpA